MKRKTKKTKRFTILVGCDFHIPFQSDKAIDVWLKFSEYLQPEVIILHEVMDFYQLSRFDKDPKRALTMQDDLDATFAILKRIRKTCPKSRIILLDSNHQFRLQKYLATKAPELSYLRSMNIVSLLRLKELNIESKKDITIRDVLFKHGTIVRQQSGYTATSEMNKTGCTGLSGHTHRLGQVFKRLRGGFYTWIECGCLCDLEPDYCSFPDWQQGCAVVSFEGMSKHFFATAIPIIDHTIMWGRRTFR